MTRTTSLTAHLRKGQGHHAARSGGKLDTTSPEGVYLSSADITELSGALITDHNVALVSML